MKNYRNLGKILFTNLILNCDTLQSFAKYANIHENCETYFKFLPDEILYSRLMSSINFDSLSQKDKDLFLLKKSDAKTGVSDKELYCNEMMYFTQEAHNRTCKELNVNPVELKYAYFSKSNLGNNFEVYFNIAKDNIVLNVEKDYSLCRPSYLMEVINSVTRERSFYLNILKAIQNPEELSDRNYFLALDAAVKTYVYEDMEKREIFSESSMYLKDGDKVSPSNFEKDLYSFSKTRQNFQSANLYGGKLQEDLRRNESTYYDYLSKHLVSDSLIQNEDLDECLLFSTLNVASNGLMYKIYSEILKELAPTYYDSLGADMDKNEPIKSYLDRLEDDLYNNNGIEKPTDEEFEQFMTSKGLFITEQEDGEEDFSEEEIFDDEDDDEPDYKEFENVLPNEGKIDDIKVLPFHSEQANEVQE